VNQLFTAFFLYETRQTESNFYTVIQYRLQSADIDIIFVDQRIVLDIIAGMAGTGRAAFGQTVLHALDALELGVVICARDSARVLYCNRYAAQLSLGDPVPAHLAAAEGHCVVSVGARPLRVKAAAMPSADGNPTRLLLLSVDDPADALSQATVAKRFGLTTRERDVVGLLERGASNGEIATALCISAATSKRHVENILAKLGARCRAAVPDILNRLRSGKC
jgi:DNA-binding NarL/FixJ family response regulator